MCAHTCNTMSACFRSMLAFFSAFGCFFFSGVRGVGGAKGRRGAGAQGRH